MTPLFSQAGKGTSPLRTPTMPAPKTPETIYSITINDADGNPTTLAPYRGDVLMIVNTASY